eukprot:jgi/Psemu1/284434/fgenesh1_pg.53_\
MRFKAKLLNDQLSLLHGIIAPISKLQDTHRQYAVLYLDEESVRISFRNSDSGINCFVELSQKDLFVEHRIESAAQNVIVCKVDLVSLKLALQSVVGGGGSIGSGHGRGRGTASQSQRRLQHLRQQHEVVVLKLAKRNRLPCLCLEGRHAQSGTDATNQHRHDVEIHQAIPVTILRRNEMNQHLPPQINVPTVQLELPAGRPIRPLLDKLKAMGQHVFLEGNMKGDLTIRLDHDGASMACFYSHLVPRPPEEDDDEEGGATRRTDASANNANANAACVIKVDAHKLSACLQWQQPTAQQQRWQLPVSCSLLGMVPNEMVVVHVVLNPPTVGFFTYYLPVHFLHDDDIP